VPVPVRVFAGDPRGYGGDGASGEGAEHGRR
jgi:hypothetical protein